ncbi:MAG: hypothetical protein HYY00_06670 [Chloroflexi bacterium]|nr:hypothetical protein [Chloroflexota bacterium]
MPKRMPDKQPEHVKLVPEEKFKEALKQVLCTSKVESGAQLANFQASNKVRREKKRKL